MEYTIPKEFIFTQDNKRTLTDSVLNNINAAISNIKNAIQEIPENNSTYSLLIDSLNGLEIIKKYQY